MVYLFEIRLDTTVYNLAALRVQSVGQLIIASHSRRIWVDRFESVFVESGMTLKINYQPNWTFDAGYAVSAARGSLTQNDENKRGSWTIP